jgi:hypothetical protein
MLKWIRSLFRSRAVEGPVTIPAAPPSPSGMPPAAPVNRPVDDDAEQPK